MYYHGSPIGGIECLLPNATTFRNDGEPNVYLSSNKAHAVLYAAKCHMYPYGFDKDSGLPKYHENFEGCLKEFYSDKCGYIYTVKENRSIVPLEGIRYGYLTRKRVRVESSEFIEDVYKKLLEYEKNGNIIIIRFKDMSDKMREISHKQITEILAKEAVFSSAEDYPMFLKKRFPDAWKDVCKRREQSSENKT